MRYGFDSMGIPWAIIISLLLVLVTLVFKEIFWEAMEEGIWMKLAVAGFFVLFIAASFAVGYLNPPLEGGNVNIGSIGQFFVVSE